ncbi:amino acid ABC transporter substrate-binding protein [Clostridium polyendosporum]|uniref:Amino acid ABC transporter substrate-binding protein n=1 Tax=Clostridium polyendosporum TaxID=69208 RepID=A0A919RZS8_9CLOT|nr:transporter substrate-binding domain-containing protein [Clostridium polyendosporum]GIM29487.1 amino acid ABC transporter substrate-binding protein [Clostridium polyendosporum]
MKKSMAALMLAVSVLFTGCSAAGNGSKGVEDIQKIKDRGVLKVGVKVDIPKYGYKDPKTGKIEGLEIDIAKQIAKKILGDENKIEMQAVTSKTRGPLLDSGEADLIAATFTITEERKKSYNFSEPYIKDGVGLLVKKSAGFKSYKDLDGKKIGVAQSATSKKALQEEANKLGIKVQFLEFGSFPEIKAALDSGRVDCFSVDTSILSGYLDDNTEILPDRFSLQEYGIASKKTNTELAKVVNETIADMKKSGELDKLIKKWGIN